MNGERYRAMISGFLWPHLEGMNMDKFWFQQDGATCHTSRYTITLQREMFPDNLNLISLHGGHIWPPRSYDLTPCDFFLWEYIKLQVYKNKPRDLIQLKAEIRRVMSDLDVKICERVI